MTFYEVLSWSVENKIGDLAGLAGVAISLVGFVFTLIGVFKSKNAAQRAEEAAKSTRESIRLLDTVVDFSAAISILEDIKRLHRRNEWNLLPERYSAIRKILITLRSSGQPLSDAHSAAIQSALANLRDIEAQVERAVGNYAALKPAKFNSVISTDIDNLVTVLNELKVSRSGGLR
jgi:hypothetical protein